MNKAGNKPKSLDDFAIEEKIKVDESKHEDLVGQVTLQTLEEKERKKRRGGQGNQNRNRNQNQNPNRPKAKGGDNRKKN